MGPQEKIFRSHRSTLRVTLNVAQPNSPSPNLRFFKMPVSPSSVPCVVPSGPCRSPAAGIFMEPAGCPSSAADEQPRLRVLSYQFARAYGGRPRPRGRGAAGDAKSVLVALKVVY